MYDGVRRRALPALFKALTPGTDDDRMKGALWTINSSSFGKYAIGGELVQLSSCFECFTSQPIEPTLVNEILSTLFECQQHEKACPFPHLLLRFLSTLSPSLQYKIVSRLYLRIVRAHNGDGESKVNALQASTTSLNPAPLFLTSLRLL